MAFLINRVASLVVVGLYVAGAAFGGGLKAVVLVVIFSLLPLACIWFPDEMGSVAYMRGVPLNETPGGLVIAGGWLVLLLPITAALILTLRSG
jgi:hypothetical protein